MNPVASSFASSFLMASRFSGEKRRSLCFFGVGELVKWLSKPPEPLAMQTHEPKMKVAPRGGVMVVRAKVAIKLADELAESPTWCASCQRLPPSLLRDTISSRVCR